MKLLQKSTKHKTLVQIFFSMTLAISVTTLTLSMILHFNYEKIASGIITSYAKESLRSISYSATFLHTSADNMMKQLFADPNVQYLMTSRNPSFPQLSKSLNQLNAYKSSSSFVKSVYVYNRATDTVFSTLNYGISERAAFTDIEVFNYLDHPREYNMQHPVFRQLPADGGASTQGGVFTFILSEMTAQAGTGGAIILNLSADWLRDIVLLLQENSTPGNILILDSQKHILDLVSMQAPQEDPYRACVDTILRSNAPQGSFTITSDKRQFLVAYDTSYTTSWMFARITPYTFITQQLDAMRRFTLLTGCIILLCGIVVSLLLSRRLYLPIHFMSNKIKTLEVQNWSQRKIVQQDLCRQILRGSTVFSEPDWSAAFSAGIPLVADSTVRILLLKLDNFIDFCHRNNSADRNAYRYALINMACELFAQRGAFALGVNMDDDHVVLILENDHSSTEIDSVLTDLQRKSEQYLKFSFSSAVSEAGELCHDLALLYTQCHQTIDYRLFYGHKSILFYENLPQAEPVLINYPTGEEGQLIELLIQGKTDDAKLVYQKLLTILQSTNFSTFRLMILKLLTSIYIVQDTLTQNSFPSAVSTDYPRPDALINEWETLDEMNCYFYTLFERIGNSSSLGSQLQKIKRHNVIAARMVQEIECNYADKNLSLYVLASLDDMNPVYLGRMFKKVQGCSVAEYINRVRLKRAAVLLLDSEATVIDIADTVGFANSNYFYSVFKKSLGVTPNVYRQCHGKI